MYHDVMVTGWQNKPVLTHTCQPALTHVHSRFHSHLHTYSCPLTKPVTLILKLTGTHLRLHPPALTTALSYACEMSQSKCTCKRVCQPMITAQWLALFPQLCSCCTWCVQHSLIFFVNKINRAPHFYSTSANFSLFMTSLWSQVS